MIEIDGLIRNESNEAYHKNPALSFSNLKTLMKSPELFKKQQDGLIPNEHKDAYDIGTAVHWGILEPETPCEFFFADESYKGSTKAGKATKADCEAQGLKLMNAANSHTVNNCIHAIQEHDASRLFDVGEAEVTWRYESEKVDVQCRSDWICHEAPAGLEMFGINQGERYVADLKTTRSIDDWKSGREWKNPLMGDFFYAGQEIYYRQIIDTILNSRVDKWLFVVVEKAEPFRVGVFKTPEPWLNKATDKVSHALGDYIARSEADMWQDRALQGVFTAQID